MWDFIVQIFPYVLIATMPILITAIGGFFSERSGVVNIGLEGLMVIGGFACAIYIRLYTDNIGFPVPWVIWTSLLVAALAGGIFSLLHAYASISLKADQVISGTAINLLATSITIYLARLLTGSQNVQIAAGLPRTTFPTLSKIPIIGPLLFTNAYMSTFVVIGIVILSWFVVYKTPFGLRLRACGEHPHAADSMGINVKRMRYIAVFLSGVLAGIGGALIILISSREFNGTVAGIGFLALATLIFGQWTPWKIGLAALFFGFMSTLGQMAKVNEVLKQLSLPNELYSALPYVMTLIALVIFSRNSLAPKAVGEPYDAGKR